MTEYVLGRRGKDRKIEYLHWCSAGQARRGFSHEWLDTRESSFELLSSKGGAWLGVIREWIQCKFRNGESVTWGSQEYLTQRPLTVNDLEFLAARIAAAAMNEKLGL